MPNPLNSVTVADAYTDAATIQDVWNSRGGWLNISGEAVYTQLQYGPRGNSAYGSPSWTQEMVLGAGAFAIIPDNATGVRFRNYTAGSVATVSASIAQGDEPALAVSSLGAVTVSGSGFVAYGIYTGGLRSTGGTTFATGISLLQSSLSFTADGATDYVVRCSAPAWYNGSAAVRNYAELNLDGADGGLITERLWETGNQPTPFSGAAMIWPRLGSGTHTVNVTLYVSGGTGVVAGGAGGAGVLLPILVSVEAA